MSAAIARDEDPFRSMLAWSAVLHLVVFGGIVIAGRLAPRPSLLPQPENVAFVIPGVPGPVTGGVGGSPSPPPPPQPKPPEPEPEPEPEKKEEPRVVRPTKEHREQLPMPDAKPAKRKPKPEKPSSGLIGRDEASAPSAKLKGDNPSGLPGLGLGGAGGGTPFDQEFEYAYYVQQMFARIYQNWQKAPVRGGKPVVIIRFTILRNGSVQNVEVEQSSGIPFLDMAAQRAILLSDPMPPLPNSYPRDQVGVHLRFEYSDQG